MWLYTLPVPPPDQAAEAEAMAEETMSEVRAHGNPYYIALAGIGFSRALAGRDRIGRLPRCTRRSRSPNFTTSGS